MKAKCRTLFGSTSSDHKNVRESNLIIIKPVLMLSVCTDILTGILDSSLSQFPDLTTSKILQKSSHKIKQIMTKDSTYQHYLSQKLTSMAQECL